MNQELEIDIPKREQKRAFDKLDTTKNGTLRVDELKNVASILQAQQDEDAPADEEEGEDGKQISEIEELYANAKSRLESKNQTLETIIYTNLKYMPMQLMNVKGCRSIFEKLHSIISKQQAEEILKDVRKSLDRFECSYKDFIDYMTKKRINVAFMDKGFVDPIVAQCCHQIAKIANSFEISF